MKYSHKLDDGVIGYQAQTVQPAITEPIAAAALPSMMILPCVLFMGSTAKRVSLGRLALANSAPAFMAATLTLTALALPLNCLLMAFSTCAMSIFRSSANTPT